MVGPLLLLTSLTTPAQAEVVRRALLVGANDGGLDLPTLRYTQNDVDRMRQVLTELGGFADEDIIVLQGADRATLEVELEGLPALEEDDLFLFYYSGHADARGLRLGDELYPFDTLKGHFARIDADVKLGILDACRSGQITQAKGAVVVDPFLQQGLDASGEAWITASSGDELAQESRSLEGSFFTHHLVAGLRGAADNGDGVVSLGEAYSYAYTQTVERTSATGVTQHPEYDFRLAGKGDLALTQLSTATSQVTLSAGYGGEIAILRDGILVAEVNKPVDQEMTLALQPGTYTLRRRDGETVREVRLGLDEGAHRMVGTRWGEAASQVATAKGSNPSEPFNIVETGKTVVGTGKDVAQSTAEVAREFEFRDNPSVALGFSTLIPGAGQIYNGQKAKGVGYLLSAWAMTTSGFAAGNFTGDGVAFEGSSTGPNFVNLAGFAIWGAAASEAYYTRAYGDERPERPITGVQMSLETNWHTTFNEPHTAGLAVDWTLTPHISIGLDRTGLTRSPLDDGWVVATGGRVTFAPEWERFRPAAVIAMGPRFGQQTANQNPIRIAAGGALQARYYWTPRYFVTFESRVEVDGGETKWVNGGGIGWHLGG